MKLKIHHYRGCFGSAAVHLHLLQSLRQVIHPQKIKLYILNVVFNKLGPFLVAY